MLVVISGGQVVKKIAKLSVEKLFQIFYRHRACQLRAGFFGVCEIAVSAELRVKKMRGFCHRLGWAQLKALLHLRSTDQPASNAC